MTVYSRRAPKTKMMQAITQHSIAVRPSACNNLWVERRKSRNYWWTANDVSHHPGWHRENKSFDQLSSANHLHYTSTWWWKSWIFATFFSTAAQPTLGLLVWIVLWMLMRTRKMVTSRVILPGIISGLTRKLERAEIIVNLWALDRNPPDPGHYDKQSRW